MLMDSHISVGVLWLLGPTPRFVNVHKKMHKKMGVQWLVFFCVVYLLFRICNRELPYLHLSMAVLLLYSVDKYEVIKVK